MVRTRVWNNLCNLRYKTYILALLTRKYQKQERSINIFLAIASSGSIAAWAIWKVEPILWGTVIAVSQVITVTKPYLPFYKYVKELNSKWTQAENLNLEIERIWNRLQEDKIDDDSADESNYDIKKRMNEIFNFSDETIIDVSKNLDKEAMEQFKVHIRTYYGVEMHN